MKWKLLGGIGLLGFIITLFLMPTNEYKKLTSRLKEKVTVSSDDSILKPKLEGKQTVSSVKALIEDEIYNQIREDLNSIGLDSFPNNLLFVGLKQEQNLEVYTLIDDQYRLIKTYPFTASSGDLGPKLKQGDLQIPEGIYGIEYLNPYSSYYLSMKVSYPNEFDKAKAKIDNRSNLGGDIFIHGRSASVGCIPIGDLAIEELFIMVINAGVENVKVIISPKDFRIDSIYPEIENLSWSKDLYDLINSELQKISKPVML